jgi:hypothetical protein
LLRIHYSGVSPVCGIGPESAEVTLYTTDAGLSWRLVYGPFEGVEHKVVRMQSPTFITLLTSTGTATSSDGGVIWQPEQSFGSEIPSDMDLASTGRGVIGGTNGRIYYTGSITSGVEEGEGRRPWEKLSAPMLW